MTSPYLILDDLVAKLKDTPALLLTVGNDRSRISAYKDAYAQENSLDLAVHKMPSPSILLAWQSSGLGSFGDGERFKHRLSIYLRAGAERGTGYADMMASILDGTPASTGLKLINSALVNGACYALEVADGGMSRQYDSEGIEYFEIQISVGERS